MTGRSGHISRVAVTAFLLSGTSVSAVSQEWGPSVHVFGTYTTTAKLYPNPSSPSPFIRNQYVTLDDLTGLSVELRHPLDEGEFAVGVSAAYIAYVEDTRKPIALGGVLRTLSVRDGFSVIPVELSGIAEIPLESESYRLSMSAGIGAYFARRILEVEGAGIDETHPSVGFGIHVSVTFGYRLVPGIWMQFASTFRDPDVTMEYVFDRSSITVNGGVVALPSVPMSTRVNIDGMTLALGVMLEIPQLFSR